MKKLLTVLLILSVVVGCRRSNQYQTWDRSLSNMTNATEERYTEQDVSLLLGCTPEKCEPVPSANDVRQCYWKIDGGRIKRVGGGWNYYGGGFSGSGYDRYYHCTCRFENDRFVNYTTNWDY